MNDEESFLTSLLSVAMFVGLRGPQARQRSITILSGAVRCGMVWCAEPQIRSIIRPGIGSPRTRTTFKKFSEPRQSRSTRRETGANRHPVQTRRLMSRQRQIPRWSRRRTRRMSGMGMPWVASCAWKGSVGTRGDRAALEWGRSPAPPRKLRWVV